MRKKTVLSTTTSSVWSTGCTRWFRCLRRPQWFRFRFEIKLERFFVRLHRHETAFDKSLRQTVIGRDAADVGDDDFDGLAAAGGRKDEADRRQDGRRSWLSVHWVLPAVDR